MGVASSPPPAPAVTRELLQRHLNVIRAADQASRGVDRPRLYEKLVAMAAAITRSDFASIYLLDADGATMSLAATHGYHGPLVQKYAKIPADGATGSAVKALTPSAVSTKNWPIATRADLEAEGFVENALCPLHAQGRVIGSLNLARITETPYTDDDLLTGAIVAYEVTNQIETARLREESQRRAADLTLIHELGQMIAGELDLRRVLDTGVRHLARIADVPQAFLLLYDAASGDLYNVASTVDGPEARTLRLKQGDPSLSMQAFLERRPLLIEDLNRPHPGLRAAEHLIPVFGQHAVMAIPLISRGVAIGAALLGETRADRKLTTEVLERAVAMSDQLATALANAQLVDDLRKSYRELQQAQDLSIQRERLAALGELAASVAHEVRNPLAVIFNSLGALERLLPPVDDAAVLHRIATEEARRLNGIIGALLDFARPAEPDLQEHPLSPVVLGAVEAASNALSAPKTRVVCDVPELGAGRIDAQLVRQGVINLLMNALQAAGANGRVDLRASLASEDAVLQIEVLNEGPKIPAEVAPQIFQPFFTTKATGTGLGLAIVKRIAEAHRGSVAHGEEDGRTVFRLRLAVRPSDAR